MSNVTPLNQQGFTPQFVLNEALGIQGLEQIFIVAYRDDKMPTVMFSGSLLDAKAATFDLHKAINDFINSRIGPTPFDPKRSS